MIVKRLVLVKNSIILSIVLYVLHAVESVDLVLATDFSRVFENGVVFENIRYSENRISSQKNDVGKPQQSSIKALQQYIDVATPTTSGKRPQSSPKKKPPPSPQSWFQKQ